MNTVSIIRLGCPKNMVDAEVMEALLFEKGFRVVDPSERADVVIVNTCTFIDAAKEEAIDEIFGAIARKNRGECTYVIMAGCMAQRYGAALEKELPEVDLFVGVGEVPRIAAHVSCLIEHGRGTVRSIIGAPDFLMDASCPRVVSTPTSSAFIKIAEGCSNYCSYCIIPTVRGAYRSRTPDDIIREAEGLGGQGIRELILTAQETTWYGHDLPGRPTLSLVMRELASLDCIKWVRLLYTHPLHLTDDLFKTMAEEDKICNYIDMPVQHIDDDILKAMNRRGGSDHIRSCIAGARAWMPEITLRTSLIVGFPGETVPQFTRLREFVKEARFDHLGVFTYSKEEGTAAAEMPCQVAARTKESRKRVIMETQAPISFEKNQALIGSIQEVLVQEPSDIPEYDYIGRTQSQAPEIDGITYVNAPHAAVGTIITCRIDAADTYDLYGTIIAVKRS